MDTEEAQKKEKEVDFVGTVLNDTIIEFSPLTSVLSFLSVSRRSRARVCSHSTTDFGSQQSDGRRDQLQCLFNVGEIALRSSNQVNRYQPSRDFQLLKTRQQPDEDVVTICFFKMSPFSMRIQNPAIDKDPESVLASRISEYFKVFLMPAVLLEKKMGISQGQLKGI